jgi:hypothetical protein
MKTGHLVETETYSLQNKNEKTEFNQFCRRDIKYKLSKSLCAPDDYNAGSYK